MKALRNPSDFWSGLLFVVAGGVFLTLSRSLEFGTPTRMGPSFFPVVLSILLIVIGLLVVGRSLMLQGEPLEGAAIKALALVTGSGVLFGLLVRDGGLILATSALVIVAAAASRRFHWLTALAMAAVLATFCAVVFVWGLGLSIPLVGAWFGE